MPIQFQGSSPIALAPAGTLSSTQITSVPPPLLLTTWVSAVLVEPRLPASPE